MTTLSSVNGSRSFQTVTLLWQVCVCLNENYNCMNKGIVLLPLKDLMNKRQPQLPLLIWRSISVGMIFWLIWQEECAAQCVPDFCIGLLIIFWYGDCHTCQYVPTPMGEDIRESSWHEQRRDNHSHFRIYYSKRCLGLRSANCGVQQKEKLSVVRDQIEGGCGRFI